jgi:hypothetical protein
MCALLQKTQCVMWVCLCVCERERDRESVCVCVCVFNKRGIVIRHNYGLLVTFHLDLNFFFCLSRH